MTDTSVIRSDFYVYALLRGDCTPFYIGMGVGDRWLQHERFADLKNTHKNRIIRKMIAAGWPDIPKIKLAAGLTRPEAVQIERDMIALILRYPAGPLANKTDGGEGLWNPDQETREKMRQARKRFVFTPEIRAKLSAARLGKKSGPHSPDRVEKNRQAHLGMKHTSETRAKMSRTKKGRIFHSKQLANIDRTGVRHKPETIEKMKKSWPKRRERLQELGKLRWENPDFRARIMAKWTPEKRAEAAEKMRIHRSIRR